MTYKATRSYIGYRAFCVVGVLTWWAVCILDGLSGEQTHYSLWALPVALPAIFLVFNLMAFRFPYSIFGRLERTSAPSEEPIAIARASSGQVGLLTATSPFFTWRLYRSGISFAVLGVGSGFVSISQITRTKKRFFGGCAVWHSSPEIRSPIAIPSSEIYAQLVPMLGGGTSPA